MGIVIRQSLKATIVSYVGIGLGAVNTLFISLYFLSADQVGFTIILFQASSFFAAFAQLGSPYVATKFFPFFKNEEKQHKGFMFFLLSYSSFGFIIFCITFILFKAPILSLFDENKSPLLIHYAGLILPYTFFIIFQTFLEAYCRIHSRIVIPSIIREIFLRVFNTILILLYGFNYISFDLLVYLLVSSYGLALLFLIFYVKWLNKLYIKPDFSSENIKYFKQMMAFGIVIVLGGIGSIMAVRIDSFMLSQMKGEGFVAIYSIAMFMAQVIEMPQRAVSQISTPIISQAWKEDQILKVEEIYKKSALNLLIIGALLFLIIWCSVDEIFLLTPKTEIYKQGKMVLLCLGIAKVFDMGSGLHSEIIQYSKYYSFTIFTVLLLALLTIITNFIFIPIYGVDGAGYAFLISYITYALVKIIFLWYKFKIQPFSNKTFIVLLLSFLIYIISYFLHYHTNNKLLAFLSIFSKSLIIILLFVYGIYRFKISEEVNNILEKGFKIIKQKLRFS